MEKRNYAGLAALIEKYKLNTPLPATRSAIVVGTRKTEIKEGEVAEFYPKSYAPSNTYEHIKFALRYEPIDLAVFKTLFKKLEKERVTEYIKSEPTGLYARKLWYLYELLTGEKLAVSDVPRT